MICKEKKWYTITNVYNHKRQWKIDQLKVILKLYDNYYKYSKFLYKFLLFGTLNY